MRIVNTDNFNSDYLNESFELYEMSEEAAREIADVMNKHFSDSHSFRYWKVVDNDYELAPAFEP